MENTMSKNALDENNKALLSAHWLMGLGFLLMIVSAAINQVAVGLVGFLSLAVSVPFFLVGAKNYVRKEQAKS